jgi:hypothetical protein
MHHVLIHQTEREFSLENVKAVICASDRKTRIGRGMHGGQRWKFKKTVDGRRLAVVAEIRNTDCWLLTAYYEG